METPSFCEGTRVFEEVMSTSPSAKLPRINFDMQQDICLVNKRLQSLVVVEILSSSIIPWPVVPSVAHLDLSPKLCSLLNEQQSFIYKAPGPAIGPLLSEKIVRHATEQQMEDLTQNELAQV
ncbi:hypothetical protein BGAL_0283g00020 [Botrytis galanthina]|uniref:Uncharacterized protein n=1 Tax=Botrytis galanthina TaxID=278940 RepID=A0A4S8QW99_9HELO|nr:hypothetical protein BGAL_0283g00020 [Botrytis galanthina]